MGLDAWVCCHCLTEDKATTLELLAFDETGENPIRYANPAADLQWSVYFCEKNFLEHVNKLTLPSIRPKISAGHLKQNVQATI